MNCISYTVKVSPAASYDNVLEAMSTGVDPDFPLEPAQPALTFPYLNPDGSICSDVDIHGVTRQLTKEGVCTMTVQYVPTLSPEKEKAVKAPLDRRAT